MMMMMMMMILHVCVCVRAFLLILAIKKSCPCSALYTHVLFGALGDDVESQIEESGTCRPCCNNLCFPVGVSVLFGVRSQFDCHE